MPNEYIKTLNPPRSSPACSHNAAPRSTSLPTTSTAGGWELRDETKIPGHPLYDVSMSDLRALQREYEATFHSGLELSQAISNRKALKAEMRTIWQKMTHQAIETFHNRTRCLDCNQTPITSTSYFEMNHQLPRAAYAAWKKMCARMEAQRPEILTLEDWMEYLGELRFIEMWYWEDNVASLGCGRVSWNGMLVPSPVSDTSSNGEPAVVKVPKIFSRMS